MDILVLGGGPAGVTAAIYAARAGRSVTLVFQDRGTLGRAERIGNFYGFPEPMTGPALFDPASLPPATAPAASCKWQRQPARGPRPAWRL